MMCIKCQQHVHRMCLDPLHCDCPKNSDSHPFEPSEDNSLLCRVCGMTNDVDETDDESIEEG